MSLNFEIFKPNNIIITSRHLLASPLAARLRVSDRDQAESLLMKWLKTAIDIEDNLEVPVLVLPIYNGYWAHLVITGKPTIAGNRLESILVPSVKAIQANALDANEIIFTVNRSSAETGTKIVNVNFLVNLAKWSND